MRLPRMKFAPFFSSKIAFYILLSLLFLGLSLSASAQFEKNVVIYNRNDRMRLHVAIMHGIANSPYRYRVLYPLVTSTVMHFLPPISFIEVHTLPDMPYSNNSFDKITLKFIQTWYLIDTTSFFLIFLATYFFLEGLSVGYKILGSYLAYNAVNAVLIRHSYQPWSLFEGFLFPFAFLVASKINRINQKKLLSIYAVIIVVASFNRETGIFIAIFFLIKTLLEKNRKLIFISALYFLLSLSILIGLRIVRGAAPDEISIAQIYYGNVSMGGINLFKFESWNMFLLFWVPAFLGFFFFWKKLLPYLILLVLYIPFFLIFGIWGEMRLFIPVMSIFIFSGLLYIQKLENTLFTKINKKYAKH